MAKPFDLRELLLRVAAILRRARPSSASGDQVQLGERLTLGAASVDFKSFTARTGEREVQLSAKETMILRYLAERSGEVVSRAEILDGVWGFEAFPTTRTIDNFIVRLRRVFGTGSAETRATSTPSAASAIA